MPESSPPILEEYVGEVREPVGFRRAADDIAQEIRHALADDVGLDARDIRVEVEDGKVRLSGAVRTCGDMRRAERHVCAVAGTSSVVNDLVPADTTDDCAGAAEASAAAKMGKPDYDR